MRIRRFMTVVALAGLALAGFSALQRGLHAQAQRDVLAWAPMPTAPSHWVAPHRPHWKLSELLAKHKSQPTWTETVVSDNTLRAEYISMAPGAKTPRQFHPDTRAWWIVQDGQIRFTIEGQEPFVASKGFLVQVPYRNVYSMETVGDKPSLRLEVNIGGATTMYPIDEKPAPVPGFDFVKVRISGKGAYDARNKPYVDFNAVAAGTDQTRRFIADDRAVANIIRGKPQNPAPTDKGHFHLESAEFWFILEGQIRYRIGSLPVFLADQGDIVYVPKQTWHLASHGPTPMSTRLAMNGYQDLLHNFEPTEDQTTR
jgi:mannose-6-phosphate isomerase-like protein (cupin superfamily)